ncbi:MAG: alpha/beta hydrolase, partial [Mucinivorans sp.]
MIIRNSLILILFVGTFMSSMAQGRQSAIVLNTPSGDIYGSLFVPAGDSSTTVAIIIAGSGPTDRDGNQIMMRNNSLLMLSQALACKNIATVRYDKRGIASSRDAAPTEN